jgi:ectoine hydroxylase-related dioxygenase (phytanoyl-CoA dioxygenase family)
MNSAAKYLFDLNGYIVIRNVFNKAEVLAANKVIDRHAGEAQERTKGALRNTMPNTPLAGDGVGGRQDLGGVLEWGAESTFFRSVLDHPMLVPYFNTLLGPGYRMDHMPFAILQNRGSEGFSLHGGTVDCVTGEYNPHISYNCVNGRMHCHLLAVSVALADARPGDGGYVVVPGSHKANFAAPPGMVDGTDFAEFVVQPDIRAGDVLLFSEGTVHGARAWTAEHQRRTVLYRFAPPT